MICFGYFSLSSPFSSIDGGTTEVCNHAALFLFMYFPVSVSFPALYVVIVRPMLPGYLDTQEIVHAASVSMWEFLGKFYVFPNHKFQEKSLIKFANLENFTFILL